MHDEDAVTSARGFTSSAEENFKMFFFVLCMRLKVIHCREASVKDVLIAEGTFHFKKCEEISHGSTFWYMFAKK